MSKTARLTGKSVLTKAWKNLKDDIKEHSRWLLMFGAAVVFLTFVVKEVYRDNLKEAMSSFEATHNTFEIREQNNRILKTLTELRERTMSLEQKAYPAIQMSSDLTTLNYWAQGAQLTKLEAEFTEDSYISYVFITSK